MVRGLERFGEGGVARIVRQRVRPEISSQPEQRFANVEILTADGGDRRLYIGRHERQRRGWFRQRPHRTPAMMSALGSAARKAFEGGRHASLDRRRTVRALDVKRPPERLTMTGVVAASAATRAV